MLSKVLGFSAKLFIDIQMFSIRIEMKQYGEETIEEKIGVSPKKTS